MRIIQIAALENGAHRNQTGNFSTIPAGWAVVPDGMLCENFPFGEVEAAEVEGVTVVTSWSPLPLPEDPGPELEPEEVTTADMAAAIMEGVNEV